MTCCGKTICGGCADSFCKSGNMGKCPFCKAEIMSKTNEERVEELKKRVDVNDAGAISALADCYYNGKLGLLQDQERAIALWKQASELGSSQAHFQLGTQYDAEGNSKKVKFHYESAAMAGHEGARCNLGYMEYNLGNMEQAVKHWIMSASAGDFLAMNDLLVLHKKGFASRTTMDSTLAAYNTSCAEMRSSTRDAYICAYLDDQVQNSTLSIRV
jgi:TPR repeat protein